jgi:hypothetical protein
MSETLVLLAAFVAVFFTTLLVGALFSTLLPRPRGGVLYLSFCYGLGSVVLTGLFHVLGAAHVLSREVWLFVHVVLLVGSSVWLGQQRVEWSALFARAWEWLQREWLLVLGVIWVIAPLVPWLFLPPVSWDGTAYHLLLPKLFLQTGQLLYRESFPQTTYPVGLLALYGISESLQVTRLSNLIAFSWLIALCSTSLWGLRRWLSRQLSVVVTVALMARPLLYSESAVTTFIDYGYAWVSLLLVISLVSSIEDKQWKWLSWACIWVTLLLLSKYTAIVIAGAALLGSLGYAVEQKIRTKSWLPFTLSWSLGWWVLLVLVFVMGWYGRNFYYTHNPIYPYLNNIFRGYDYDPASHRPLINEVKALNDATGESIKRLRIGLDNPSDWLMVLESAATVGLLVLGVLTLLVSKEARWRWMSVAGVVALGIMSVGLGPIYRYYLPILPWILLPAGVVIAGRGWRAILIGGVLMVVVGLQLDATLQARSMWLSARPKRYMLDIIKSPDHQRQVLWHQDNLPAIEYCNTHLDPTRHKVLSVFDNRLYYFDVPAEFMHPSSFGLFTNPRATEPEQILSNLKAQDFTHLLVSRNWGSHANLHKQAFEHLVAEHTRLLFFERGVGVYEILY